MKNFTLNTVAHFSVYDVATTVSSEIYMKNEQCIIAILKHVQI